MKRIGGIAEAMASRKNVELAVHEARKRRNKDNELRRNAERFMRDREKSIAEVMEILRTGEWRIGGYRSFIRVEHGKERKIDWNPSFRDNVIQHAIHQTVGKRLVATFIPDTYSGIRKRGTSYGAKRIRKFLRGFPPGSPLYVLKLDVRKFYPSIDTSILKRIVRRHVKDRIAVKLLDRLVDSHPDGLPIGNYLSQLLANLSLADADHVMAERSGVARYLRYCDDIVMMDSSKERIMEALKLLESLLAELGLSVKPNVQVFPIERSGIDFMGLVFRRFETRLRKRIERAFRKKGAIFKAKPSMQAYRSLSSYYGWTKALSHGGALWDSVMGMGIKTCLELARKADGSAQPAAC